MRLGMRELPRRGADLLRGAMRIAEISRNSFGDDEADEADFSALARLHSDFRLGHKLTRQARLNTVARSASPTTCFIGKRGGAQPATDHEALPWVPPAIRIWHQAKSKYPIGRTEKHNYYSYM